MMDPDPRPTTGRRQLLTAALVGGIATATAPAAAAATSGRVHIPGTTRFLDHTVDVARATPQLVRQLSDYFTDKTDRKPAMTMAHFSRQVIYVDAILGWSLSWQALDDLFARIMPMWPATAESYPVKILGNADSALVMFTDTPELFGHELRPLGFVDFRHGQIVRWVDYWDGREFTLADIAAQRTPADQFPDDFGEKAVGENAAPAMRRTAHALAQALAAGDAVAASALFSADGIFEDRVLHTGVHGQQAIRSYLGRALHHLPYGLGAQVRHVVGSTVGGGYEWKQTTGPVHRGGAALELDQDGRISHFTAVWDGSLVSGAELNRIQSLTIES
ncbi:hypothetical protein ACIQVL_19640 [Streptomyces sp. NPDC090499]|uniref:hypothetical protein n=1 Tax=unclassified Streptomyces TaxID=2593676 RepID=UPI0038054542